MTNKPTLSIYYKQKEELKETMEFFCEMGFDQVVTEHAEVGAAAKASGFDVVHAARCPWVKGKSRTKIEDEVKSVLKEYGRHLDSIIMNDEVMYGDWKDVRDGKEASRQAETFKEFAAWIHEIDSQVPLSISFLCPSTGWTVSQRRYFGQYLPAINTLRLNVYPYLHTIPLRAVTQWVDDSYRHMSDVQRQMPLTITLQTWRWDDKLPPIDQLRVMSFLALLSGASLSFYDYNALDWAKTPGFKDGFFEMMTEGSPRCELGVRALGDELKGKRLTHYLDRDGIFHAEVSTESNTKTFYYSINTTGELYEDLEPYQIVRSDQPIRPYPPKDPYPLDVDF